MKKLLALFVMALLILPAAGAWAQFKDGQWEITTRVEMQGMPQQMPPATFSQCITKNDPVPQNADKNYDCKTTHQKVSGNTVTYTLECQGPEGTMTTTGKNTYTGNTMEGSATTRFKMKGGPEMQMKSKMTGKYLGPCTK